MTIPRYALPSTQSITDKTLQSGIRVLVYENPSVESVVIYGSLRAGSIYDDVNRVGMASMTAATLMRGTTTRDFEALHSELEDIGAEFEYSTGKHRVMFSGRSLAEDFTTLVDVFADSLLNPRFDGSEIHEERQKRLTELKYAHQDTRYMASHTFRKKLYPENHPYHYSSYGSLTSLPSFTPDDLRSFHLEQFGPSGMVVVVVGAVTSEIAIAILEDALGDWSNPNQHDNPDLPKISLPNEVSRTDIHLIGKLQADIVMGLVGPSRHAEDFIAAQIANSVLGEFGMMGRVGNIIREQLGLAYYAYSRLDSGEGIGAWTVSIGVAPDNIDIAIEKAQSEIERLTTELISEADLDDNQAYFTGRLPLRLESNYGLASTIHILAQYDLDLDYLLQYHDLIYGITRQDVLDAAQNYLDPKRLIVSVVS